MFTRQHPPVPSRDDRRGRLHATALAVALVTALLAAVPRPAAAQEVLTNESVVAMVKGGLAESIVLAKIRTSPSRFDVRTEALVALKRSGVSDRIIEAMVSAPAAPTAADPAAPAAPPTTVFVSPAAVASAKLKDRDAIYHARGGMFTEMQAQVASIETNHAFFTYKSEIVLSGRKATYRIADRQPVFLSSYQPTEALLVKLKPGDDSNDRNLKMGSGAFMPFGGTTKQGVRTEDRITVTSERDASGLYRITPAAALPPGEYAFVVLSGAAAAGRLFDFGIE